MINVWFMTAGVVLLLTFLLHFIAGSKRFELLNPLSDEKLYPVFLMGCSGLQIISVDLLLSAIFLLLIGLNIIPYSFYLLLFIAILYLGYTLFWLGTLVFKKAKRYHYIRLFQWIIFLFISVLLIIGILYESI